MAGMEHQINSVKDSMFASFSKQVSPPWGPVQSAHLQHLSIPLCTPPVLSSCPGMPASASNSWHLQLPAALQHNLLSVRMSVPNGTVCVLQSTLLSPVESIQRVTCMCACSVVKHIESAATKLDILPVYALPKHPSTLKFGVVVFASQRDHASGCNCLCYGNSWFCYDGLLRSTSST